MADNTAIVPKAAFEPANISEALDLSKTLSVSALLPEALRNKPSDVMVILMTGRELGLSPMQSIRSISVIKGKPVMNADAIVGLCLRHRDICERFTLVESTDKLAAYEAQRVGSPPVKMSFSIEQAKAAGLTGKDNWRNFPAAMLRARCSSHLARAVFPDLVAGLYDTDEGEAIRGPERKERPAPRVVSGSSQPVAATSKAAPAPVVEAEVVEAQTASGATLRITDAPEPPPPSDEHAPSVAPEREPGADDAAPSAYDELMGLIGTVSREEWLTKKHEADKTEKWTREQYTNLKNAFDAGYPRAAGGAK